MIDLYYWTTPNGHKISMFLEEAGLEYRIIPVNIGAGDQFKPGFLRISPNNCMPAIVDHPRQMRAMQYRSSTLVLSLIYLAGKIGKLIPKDLRGRKSALEWLFWQVSGLGPMEGQNHHFSNYAAEKIPCAIDRYVKETNRLFGVLDCRLRCHIGCMCLKKF
jgi:GST-like protein